MNGITNIFMTLALSEHNMNLFMKKWHLGAILAKNIILHVITISFLGKNDNMLQ